MNAFNGGGGGKFSNSLGRPVWRELLCEVFEFSDPPPLFQSAPPLLDDFCTSYMPLLITSSFFSPTIFPLCPINGKCSRDWHTRQTIGRRGRGSLSRSKGWMLLILSFGVALSPDLNRDRGNFKLFVKSDSTRFNRYPLWRWRSSRSISTVDQLRRE